MKNIARWNETDRSVLFLRTAELTNLKPMIVEKDFWVCFMLDYLFHDCSYKNVFSFKGGTSLSKSYHVIERFSEDIDLILDWRKLDVENQEPWSDRSRTKQDIYNKQINHRAAEFYADELVPTMNRDLKEILGDGNWVAVDELDEMIVNFYYPHIFNTDYIRPVVRLEIGPLAEWLPSHETVIMSFAAEKYPSFFEQRETSILTIDVERTFWEKATIMHKLANFPEEKPLPARYARHMYDIYSMGNSWVKDKAFARKELLEQDVLFKNKFYYTKSAHYETATLSDIMIVPPERVKKPLEEDYLAMRSMIYGNMPDFTEIIQYLEVLEKEIHELT